VIWPQRIETEPRGCGCCDLGHTEVPRFFTHKCNGRPGRGGLASNGERDRSALSSVSFGTKEHGHSYSTPGHSASADHGIAGGVVRAHAAAESSFVGRSGGPDEPGKQDAVELIAQCAP